MFRQIFICPTVHRSLLDADATKARASDWSANIKIRYQVRLMRYINVKITESMECRTPAGGDLEAPTRYHLEKQGLSI